MDIDFIRPVLRNFDLLRTEALYASFFSDEQPLTGTLGLVDWRMCGLLSQCLKQGRLNGHRGESSLVPLRPRFDIEKLFLFGMGPRTSFSEDVFLIAVENMFRTLSRVRVRASACVLPGRALNLIDPESAMELFLDVAQSNPEIDAVTVIETSEAQKCMIPIVERAKRRARSTLYSTHS
ncbi:MAG: M17 family peptidase N-terminal domain-containing protein [Myxococcota bacterium]